MGCAGDTSGCPVLNREDGIFWWNSPLVDVRGPAAGFELYLTEFRLSTCRKPRSICLSSTLLQVKTVGPEDGPRVEMWTEFILNSILHGCERLLAGRYTDVDELAGFLARDAVRLVEGELRWHGRLSHVTSVHPISPEVQVSPLRRLGQRPHGAQAPPRTLPVRPVVALAPSCNAANAIALLKSPPGPGRAGSSRDQPPEPSPIQTSPCR